MKRTSFKKSWLEWIWDAFCLVSIIGIWPRFIEPNLVFTLKATVPLPNLPQGLEGLTIAHLSDLHFNHYSSPRFFKRLQKKILKLNPDLILISGDLLTYAQFSQKDLARNFFRNLSAKFGIFACLGNHDYDQYATLDSSGGVIYGQPDCHPLMQGLKRLFGKVKPEQNPAPRSPHPELVEFYQSLGITLLHNETTQIGDLHQCLNLSVLGDPMTGNFKPEQAFHEWKKEFPTLVLAHSPETYFHLSPYPGDIYFFGHTHGGQVNVPFIGTRLLGTNHTFKSGMYTNNGHTIFVSRGLGSTFPFRLFAPPQLNSITLVRGGPVREPIRAANLFEPVSPDISLATPRISEQ